MEYADLFQDLCLGISGGFILYVIFSLLGYGIYKAFHLMKL